MTPIFALLMAVSGVLTGVFAGVFGVGGGIVLVPLLTLGFHYSQKAAIGTSLVALLLPVGLLGALKYYRAGDLSPEQAKTGLIIALGIFIGTYLGANIGSALPQAMLQKSFAVFLVLIAVKLWMYASA